MCVTIPDLKSGAAMRISVQCRITVPCDMLLQGEPKGPEQEENGGAVNGVYACGAWVVEGNGNRKGINSSRCHRFLYWFPATTAG